MATIRPARPRTLLYGAAILFSIMLFAAWSLSSGSRASAASDPQGLEVPGPVATAPTQVSTATPARTGTTTPVAGTPSATATPGVPTPLPTAVATLCPISFSDVTQADWFYPYVGYLFCRGAISGYADGTFRPYNHTTRGQLSKILVLAEAWPINPSGAPHFVDVPVDNAFYAYIETAYNHGVISGYADGTFRWGNNITRGQLSKVVVLAAGWPLDTTGGPHFSDVAPDSPFYAFVETAVNKRIVSGYTDGTFGPGSNATRAQLAKIVQLALVTP